MEQDFSKPRNLTDTLFKDFQLPEVSNIRPKNSNKAISLAKSKYQQQATDDFDDLELGEVSKISQKNISTQISNKSNSANENIASEDSRPMSRIVGSTRKNHRRNKNKAKVEEKKEVDIDNQIGQIAEWAQRGVKNNSDEEDFNQTETVGQTEEQQQIRRKLEEKLRTGFGQKSKGGGGLAAKALQLRKAKEGQQSTASSAEQLLQKRMVEDKKKQLLKSVSLQHQTSTEGLIAKVNKQDNLVIEQQESEEDPWDKVNQNTINRYQSRKQKQKDMTIEQVIHYYQEQFQFVEDDIQIDEMPQKVVEQEEKGCLQAMLDCFKGEDKKKKPKNNVKMAKRLISIAKKQLSNTQEQFYILQQIWSKLSDQSFSRYGAHWNQIGFQGRDPATDLRSTGILSIVQWLLFLQDHPKEGKQFAVWSMENQYPLALTHIKITGVFLDLLSKGTIRGERWQDFQRSYNALLLGMAKRMKNQFKGGDTLGTLVQDEARKIRQSYAKELSNYESQYKK